jgi:hypothetical protein
MQNQRPVANLNCREEAQEASRKSREKGGVIFSITTSDARRATTSTRSREKPRDHPPTATSQTLTKPACTTNGRQPHIWTPRISNRSSSRLSRISTAIPSSLYCGGSIRILSLSRSCDSSSNDALPRGRCNEPIQYGLFGNWPRIPRI